MYFVFWLTFLGTLVFFLAWMIPRAAHFKRPVERRMWPFLTFLLTLLVIIPPAYLGFYLWRKNIEPAWLFGYTLSLTLIYIVLGVILMYRGLRNATVNPKGRYWPRRKLLAATCIFTVLAVGTFFYLDHAMKNRLRGIVEQSGAQAKELLPQPMPDEQNAFVLYQKARELLEKDQKHQNLLDDDYKDADPTSPEVVELLAAHEETLELIRQGATLPGYRQKMDFNDMIGCEWPSYWSLRSFVRLSSLSARNKAAQGDVDGAAEDWMVMGRIANHIGSFTTLINSMVAEVNNRERLKTLEDILKIAPDLTDRLPQDRMLDDEIFKNRFIQTIRVEHMMMDQIIAQACLTDKLAEDLFNQPPEMLVTATSYLLRVFLLSGDLDLRKGMYDKIIAATSKPSPEVLYALDTFNREYETSRRGFFTAREPLDLSPYVGRMLQAQARLRLMKLALAATAYYKNKGQYPASQDDLIPHYLPEKLVDPFTGQDLAMETVPGGLDLVSQGMQIDEGDEYAGPKVFHLRLPKIVKQG